MRLIGISSTNCTTIGKVGVEDHILLKPGRLDSEERLRMQVHAALGGECLREIESQLGESNFLQMAREIAFHHHEHTGWTGISDPDICLERILPPAAELGLHRHNADVYDALSVRRVYKSAQSHEECVEVIRSEAGKHFDPSLVKVFLSIEADFREIAQQFSSVQTPAESFVEKIETQSTNHSGQEIAL